MPDGCFSLPLFLATLQYVQGLPPNKIFTISFPFPGKALFSMVLAFLFTPSHGFPSVSDSNTHLPDSPPEPLPVSYTLYSTKYPSEPFCYLHIFMKVVCPFSKILSHLFHFTLPTQGMTVKNHVWRIMTQEHIDSSGFQPIYRSCTLIDSTATLPPRTMVTCL